MAETGAPEMKLFLTQTQGQQVSVCGVEYDIIQPSSWTSDDSQ